MAQPPILRSGGPPARGSTNRGFASTDPERQRDFSGQRAGLGAGAAPALPQQAHEDTENPVQERRGREPLSSRRETT
jgi:hypothetical protein